MQRLSDELDEYISRQNERDLQLQELKHHIGLNQLQPRNLAENEINMNVVSMPSGGRFCSRVVMLLQYCGGRVYNF